MKLKLFQIDSFTDKIFGGNPACVMPLNDWLPDDVLMKIAQENSVAETAFFIVENDIVHLRWFTPDVEMDLCGHATLATAHALKTELGYSDSLIRFSTLSGILSVRVENDMYMLDFPSRMPVNAQLPEELLKSLNIAPRETFKARDFVLIYESEQEIRDISINRQLFDTVNLGTGGVIVTAEGIDCDFVSRFFTPGATFLEDPVTGSAHCSLIPYWSQRLCKKIMNAKQLSKRGGVLYCEDKGDRVIIGGKAKTYFVGTVFI